MKILAFSPLFLASVAALRLGESGLNKQEQSQTTENRQLSATNYYIDQSASTNGAGTLTDPFNDVNDAIDSLNPGDTLYLMGAITNPSYDPNYSFNGNINDPHLWHSENTMKFDNVIGTAKDTITIKPYDSSTVVRGDGGNIIVVEDCEYLVFEGLNVHGEVDNIHLDTSLDLQFVYREEGSEAEYRVDPNTNFTDEEIGNLTLPSLSGVSRPSYIDTRGIYIKSSYHITVQNCRIHHTPGNGLRASYSEYVDIIGNELHDNSRRSFSGTHALVATYTSDRRDGKRSGQAKYRVRILNNEVHHNYNEMYSWAPAKTFIHTKIDEGKGISLQRNQDFQYDGRILVANNVAYWNGYSGIHSNDGDNIDFFHNTAYMNSYTSTIWYHYSRGGKNVGISMSGGSDCKIGGNIAVVDTDTGGAAISVTADTDVTVHSNLIWGKGTAPLTRDADLDGVEERTFVADPLFVNEGWVNAPSYDFTLLDGSPAIGEGRNRFATEKDFKNEDRDENSPTLGAIENTVPS